MKIFRLNYWSLAFKFKPCTLICLSSVLNNLCFFLGTRPALHCKFSRFKAKSCWNVVGCRQRSWWRGLRVASYWSGASANISDLCWLWWGTNHVMQLISGGWTQDTLITLTSTLGPPINNILCLLSLEQCEKKSFLLLLNRRQGMNLCKQMLKKFHKGKSNRVQTLKDLDN